MNEASTLARLAVLLVRPGMVMALGPGFGGGYVSARVKVALTVFVALAMLPTVAVPASGTAAGLVGVVAREMAIGLALA
ncbi:MAG TPA: flagellar biosynthetic protein FliR, partial [Vicinamibacterales bacterium]